MFAQTKKKLDFIFVMFHVLELAETIFSLSDRYRNFVQKEVHRCPPIAIYKSRM